MSTEVAQAIVGGAGLLITLVPIRVLWWAWRSKGQTPNDKENTKP